MASEGGLRPYSSAGVGAGSAPTLAYKIASAEASNIFEGDLVKMVDDGTVVAASAVTDVAIVGVFVGCEYVNADGQTVQSNKYTSTITDDNTVAFVNVNPHQIYKIKCGNADADTTITRTEVGLRFDVEYNAGNSTTGQSGMVLDTGTAGATTVAQLKVVGCINEDGSDGAKGASGATFTHALVIIDPDVSVFGSSAGI